MLSNYVGEDRFLKGVSLYLKKKLFANSRTHDLWEGISTATGLNITELMENWITKVRFIARCKLETVLVDEQLFCLFDQIGFPYLTVTEEANGIRVRQNRFLESGAAEPKDDETIW